MTFTAKDIDRWKTGLFAANPQQAKALAEELELMAAQHRRDSANIESESKARAAAEAERDHYVERERHFIKVLNVSDCGRYRNDWNSAIEDVVRERDEARARATAAEAELATGRAETERAWKAAEYIETTERAARERAEEAHSRAAKNEVALAARAEQAEAARDAHAATALKLASDAEQAEAAAAALRADIEDAARQYDEQCGIGNQCSHALRARLSATDAGAALLAEREALRAEVCYLRLEVETENKERQAAEARVAELEGALRALRPVFAEGPNTNGADYIDAALSGTAPTPKCSRCAELEGALRDAAERLDAMKQSWLADNLRAALSGTAPAEGTTSPTDHYDKWLRVFKPAPAEGTCFECGRAAHAPDCDVLRGIKPAEGGDPRWHSDRFKSMVAAPAEGTGHNPETCAACRASEADDAEGTGPAKNTKEEG